MRRKMRIEEEEDRDVLDSHSVSPSHAVHALAVL